MNNIQIGTCGYGYYNPGENWKEKYESKLQAFSDEYSVVEINKTFYKLPMTRTCEKWRNQVQGEFEFTLKAWQAITHPADSPTYKEKEELSKAQQEQFGYFNPRDEVFNAWNQTRERAEALRAEVVVFQTPASFNCTKDHQNNIRAFINEIESGDLALAWEPRGDWNENPEKVESICNDLNLIHVADVMRETPLSDHALAYTRLHGLNENLYDYNYTYSDDEIDTLADKLSDLRADHEKVYCMFNNFGMYDNVPALKSRLLQ
ncbi:MAG: DUF72 domain-containing protein [Candidatus Marinimicrobia bacterium]|nr:DUF72 domain-containing protein [Candidatus Neomarinimicrobiota bacterium]